MIYLRALIILPLVSVLGCGSTEETTEQAPPQPQPVVVAKPPVQEKPVFETRTDTVSTVRKAERHPGGANRREAQIRFMVQIGAFKDPQNASRVQTTARQRYHLPVLNDYHTKLALYQIRIGFFETREAAVSFRSRMMREFPEDYKDTWVVQLKR